MGIKQNPTYNLKNVKFDWLAEGAIMRTITKLLIASTFSLAGQTAIAQETPQAQAQAIAAQEVKPKEVIVLMPKGFGKGKYAGFNAPYKIGAGYGAIPQLKNFEECKSKQPNQSPQALGGVAASLVGVFANVIIDNIFDAESKRLKKKLEDYQATYEAKLSIPTLGTECLRLVRGTANKDPFTPDLDIVIQLKQAADAFQIEVLQAKASTAKAKGTKVAYAVSVEFEGVYSGSDGRGHAVKYDEKVIHTGQFGKPLEASKCKLNTTKKINACSPIFPIPGSTRNGGLANLTVKVTEVGDDKKKTKIEKWEKLVGQLKDDVSETLSAAVTELLD